MVFERLIGDFKLADIEITGLADKHQCASAIHHKWDQVSAAAHIMTCPPDNPLGFDNAIQIIETGGLRIADWGDNRPVPSTELDKYLENLDVLILPIDGTEHILTYPEVAKILEKYRPRAVIPGHYLTRGSTSMLSGLKSADPWVNARKDVRRIGNGEIDLSQADLAGAKQRVYYFGDGHKDK